MPPDHDHGPGDRVRGACLVAITLLLGLSGCAVGDLLGRGSVVPLAKAEGWRDDLEAGQAPFAILEVAYDRETAERVWVENVPEGLPERTGEPELPGLYGDLDAVDFDEQVVAVWSSGESSSCPGWLASVEADEAGAVQVERADTAGAFGACTEDYNPYRMVVAVDRRHVPSPDLLPTEDLAGVPPSPAAGGLVTAYPADRS